MSFNFDWPKFSRKFHADAASMLDGALNRGPKPKVIADDIKVEDIHMGTIPPELEILEIGELSSERLRGIFRLTYAGDAHLLLSTKVQANPLSKAEGGDGGTVSPFEDVSSAFPTSATSRGILFAARPLVVPMQLRLSSMRLKAIVVLVVSKQKGITLVFKNDPLESVEVSSTFDSVAVIQKYLQQEIEGQLREMFREDLPGIIHRLSQSWLSGRHRKTTASAEPTEAKGSGSRARAQSVTTAATDGERDIAAPMSKARSNASMSASKKGKSPRKRRKERIGLAMTPNSSPPPTRYPMASTPRGPTRSERAPSIAMSKAPSHSTWAASPATSPSKTMAQRASTKEERDANTSNFALAASTSLGSLSGFSSGYAQEIERYDPTYGLRPDEVHLTAHSSNFSGLAQLAARPTRGLSDFAALSLNADKKADVAQALISPTRSEAEKRSTEPVDRAQSVIDRPIDVFGPVGPGLGLDEDGFSRLDNSDDVPDHPEAGHLPDLHQFDEDLSFDEEGDDSHAFDDSDASEEVNESDEELEDDVDEEAGDFTRYGIQPVSADFSAPSLTRLSLASTSPRQPDSARMSNTGSRSRSTSATGKSVASKVEYESVPAVGGGTIVRPRIYHTFSRVKAPEVEEEDETLGEQHPLHSIAASSTVRGPASSRTYTVRPGDGHGSDEEDDELGQARRPSWEDPRDTSTDESPSAAGHESLDTLDPDEMDPHSIAYRTQVYRHTYGRAYRPGYDRQSSSGSNDLSNSGASSQHPSHSPDEDLTARQRAWTPASRVSTAPTSAHPSVHSDRPSPALANEATIRRKPSLPSLQTNMRTPLQAYSSTSNLNHAMTPHASHHFADLVNSNHTLSPYTRTLDTKGFAVRSHPVTPSGSSVVSGSTNGSGSGRVGMHASLHSLSTPGPHTARRAPPLRTHSYDAPRSIDGRADLGPATASGLGSPASVSGRRRTFKLGSSKAATSAREDATPTASPSSSSYGRQPRSTPPSVHSFGSEASWQQERGSQYDVRPGGYSGPGSAASSVRSASYAGSIPVRRGNGGQSYGPNGSRRFHYDHRHMETSGTHHHMGSIRE